jgi:16S rRNA (cytosine1402-N4)-methyltransferase
MSFAAPAFRPRTLCSLAIGIADRTTSSARPAVVVPIERLHMALSNYHVPVMREEIIELACSLPAGVVIDGTVGGGGHAAAILSSAPQLRVLGLDRDPVARAQAAVTLAEFGERARIVASTFGEMHHVVAQESAWMAGEPVVMVLLDLGVSSRQLDDPARGFSFRDDAPLDMRMDPTTGLSAAEFLVAVDQHELARLLRENGESRFAGAIARSIKERTPTTTAELVAAVERAVPMAARRRGHVATRTFQAIRIAVNHEESQLDEGLRHAMSVLAPGGVLAVISYHSGEDRVVKAFFADEASGGCTCPAQLPCVCGAVSRAVVMKHSAQLAQASEVADNPRARSARLRVARKL